MNQLEPESVYRKEHPLLTSAIKYINENLYEDLSLDRLAKDLHFSKYYSLTSSRLRRVTHHCNILCAGELVKHKVFYCLQIYQ